MITHNVNHALEAGNLLMMEAGEIIVDIDAAEKAKLTMMDIQRFKTSGKRNRQATKCR
ncbi:MAG: hypothetical protein LBD47_11105 [Treponema sp.]|jgi:ABC-type uncharacterized transport system ATPase component|nr:hypothetical protein [Treponema sp.]